MGQSISKSDQDQYNVDHTTTINEASWSDILFIRPRPVKKCCLLRQNPPPVSPVQSLVEEEVSDESDTVFTNDAIVNTVINSFIDRSNLGFKKYGKTLERTDLNTFDWVNHTQEELMDAILYLERLKQDLRKKL